MLFELTVRLIQEDALRRGFGTTANRDRLALGLRVREVALVLGLSESQVRYRLRTGRLVWAVRPCRVDVASVRGLFPEDATRGLRERVLRRLLAGEIEAPRLGSRYQRYSFDLLCASALQWTLPAIGLSFESNVR